MNENKHRPCEGHTSPASTANIETGTTACLLSQVCVENRPLADF
jgi:hypothetical protein